MLKVFQYADHQVHVKQIDSSPARILERALAHENRLRLGMAFRRDNDLRTAVALLSGSC